MRDPRDAYERDVDNSQAGMGKQSRADVTGEEEPSGVFTVMVNGRPWKTGSSNEMFALAGRTANKHTDKKVAVKWPTGELNTVRPQGVSEDSQRVDSLVTDALKIMQGSELNDAVSALKTVLGNREYNDRRGHYSFYVRQLMDMYGQQGMNEGKADYNFDIEDLKRLESIRDLSTLKAQALALISKPSAKPMKPEKVEWFKNALERMNSPLKVIKLMYDLLLSGEGNAVVGSRSSMNPNSYRQRFSEQGVAESEVDSDGHSVDHADSGEYDYEGDQARDQMNTIVRAARRLDGLLDDNENMPEWVQMKVTLAADYLDTAADYIESNQDPKLDDIFEADEWEESGDKWKRFQKWAIDQMMRSTEKVETGNYVSKLENQYFDHPINVGPSNTSQQPFGTVTTNIGANKRWTEFVQSIIDNYENYEAEWKADSAAALLDNPEYKKFLDRAYTDFMGMGENTTEQREQHAIALSGYQVKYFGGKLFGSLFGNIKGARASMTPEVYGALEKAQYDLEQKKITDWDDKRRAEQLKFWQMLPYPIKLMVATGMGKTPAQVEAILSTSGKSDNEIMGAYIDASNVPDYTPGQQQQQRPPMNEPPRLEGKDKVGNMDADKFDAAMARLKQLAGAGPLKTVYDPTKRVYRNVPVAVQPKK
jgi:hypothetical protein